jgi:hypothetical protein
MTLTRYRNVATGVALALLGGGTLWAVAAMPWDRPPAIDPALFPRAIGFGLVLIGLVVAALGAYALRSGATTAEDAEGVPIDVEIPEELLAEHGEEQTDWKLALGLSAAIAIYCLTAFQVGFLTMTALFVIAVALLLGHRRTPRGYISLVIFSFIVTAAFYFGFFYLLGVRLPRTLLP